MTRWTFGLLEFPEYYSTVSDIVAGMSRAILADDAHPTRLTLLEWLWTLDSAVAFLLQAILACRGHT